MCPDQDLVYVSVSLRTRERLRRLIRLGREFRKERGLGGKVTYDDVFVFLIGCCSRYNKLACQEYEQFLDEWEPVPVGDHNYIPLKTSTRAKLHLMTAQASLNFKVPAAYATYDHVCRFLVRFAEHHGDCMLQYFEFLMEEQDVADGSE